MAIVIELFLFARRPAFSRTNRKQASPAKSALESWCC